ncbi:MAG: tetratricopeptide repeat protein [Kiritimatiellae bacterium]|nr:tetratricopeptide repeat protein [Kiritimatiellia bacterium]
MINKSYIFICCLLAGLVVNAQEVDDMMQLESLFNLDIQHSEVVSNKVAEAVVAEKNDVVPEKVVVQVAAVSQLSKDELELQLAAARGEIERLKGIVDRILVANRRERAKMQYNMGCLYRHGGHKLKAKEAFLAALKLNPSDSAIHYNLGILYEEDLKMPVKAHEHYKRFLELAPNDKDAGKVYEWMKALE